MVRNWLLRGAALSMVLTSPATAPAQTSLPAPPQINLKLAPVEFTKGEPAQAWVETGSLVRTGNTVVAWVLLVQLTDMNGMSGPLSGYWLRTSVDCQKRTNTGLMTALVGPNGLAQQTMPQPPLPAAGAPPGSTGAKMMDRICGPAPSGISFADRALIAIAGTRNGVAGKVPMPGSAPAPRAPLSNVMKQECAFNYQTLGDLAYGRSLDFDDEFSASEIRQLEAATKEYRSRANQIGAAIPGIIMASQSIKRAESYDKTPGKKREPGKMAALNKLKFMAAECDRMLGMSAIPLP